MAFYDLNGTVSFDLPEDYELHRELNDDGDEVINIRGEYL